METYMTIEAAAEALAPESVTPAAEPTDLGAVWDKMQEAPDNSPDDTNQEAQEASEPDTTEEPAPQESVEAEATPDSQDGVKVEPPSALPRELKAHWSEIPEAARGEFQKVLKEWNDKLSDQGRQIQGIAPIRDELVSLVKEIPQYAGMKPAEVAQDMRRFRENVIVPLESKPVETLLRVAQEKGVAEQLRAALGGEQPTQGGQQTQQMVQTITQLQRKIAQLENPEYWSERVGQITQETTLQNEVSLFAENADHWSEVESHIPTVVPLIRAKMGQDASPKDVLEAAYNLAVSQFVPDAQKAPEPAAVDEAAAIPDPEQAEKARKAKSVNVSGGPSKPRKLSQKELLSQTYDRMQKS
jgi:hypothetical protein